METVWIFLINIIGIYLIKYWNFYDICLNIKSNMSRLLCNSATTTQALLMYSLCHGSPTVKE